MLEEIIKIVPAFAATFAAIWALYLYNRQQKFKRLQNLSDRWKEFFWNDEMLAIFTLMNEIELGAGDVSQLAGMEAKRKLQFLAIIEEVALFTTHFEVDKPHARYLFQWHFYFVYRSKKTAAAFWENLGGAEEMDASYWRQSRELSAEFIPEEA